MTALHDPENDDEVICCLKAGDGRGITALLQKYGQRVAGVLRGRFGRSVPDSLLQDALHDAAMSLFLHPRSLANVQNVPGLFYVATRNEALRHVRTEKQQRHLALPDDADALIAADVADDEVPSNLSQRVIDALADLSELERDILNLDIMSDFEMRGREIATILGTTPEVVYATRNRTKTKLQKFVPEAPRRSRS